MKRIGKRYGNENTKLELTEKAEIVYSNSDPLTIIERETESGYVYDVTGIFDATDLTAEDLNSILEEWYDDYFVDDEIAE